jgi:putative transcriptional regulator
MSKILEAAHEMARDLHEVGAMSDMTMRRMDVLCLPPKRTFSADDIRRIRAASRMSQPVFAAFLNVGKTTVAQWEQGRKKPAGSAVRLLDLIDRKGIDAIVA